MLKLHLCIVKRSTLNSLIPLNRHRKPLMPIHEPIRDRANNYGREDRARVVHVILGDGQERREGHPSYHVQQVAERQDVEWDTEAAELERPVARCRTPDLADEHEEDREDVRDVEGEGLEGDERVKSGRAGDVDEGKSGDDGANEDERVKGEFESRMDLSRLVEEGGRLGLWIYVCEDVGERKTFVLCEAPDEARDGGKNVEKSAEDDGSDEGHERVGCCFGACGTIEYVDEREGRVVECFQRPNVEKEDQDECEQHGRIDGAGQDDATRNARVDLLHFIALGHKQKVI